MSLLKKNSIDFVLASASPRRKLLLEKAGYKFIVARPDIDESAFDAENISSIDLTRKLALAKAQNIAAVYPDMLILGADTVVDCDGTVIGKPAGAADAERITRLLFSAPHKVITAVALIRLQPPLEIVKTDTTIVYPKKLTELQIRRHIEKGDWRGKAGAYGIQETADEFVERIEGSFTNVMGLPIELVKKLLPQTHP